MRFNKLLFIFLLVPALGITQISKSDLLSEITIVELIDIVESLQNKVENLEKSNNGNDKEIVVDGITEDLAQKIERDLKFNKSNTVSNKYLESQLVGYAVLKGIVQKEDALDFEKAYTKIEIIEKIKLLIE